MSDSHDDSNDRVVSSESPNTHKRTISWDVNALSGLEPLAADKPSKPPKSSKPLTPPRTPPRSSGEFVKPRTPPRSPPHLEEVIAKPDRVQRDVSALSAPPSENKLGKKLWGKVQLRDVLKQAPLESEAEARVLRAMDERDPVVAPRPKLSTVNSTIFSTIPAGAEEALSESHSVSTHTNQKSAGDKWADVIQAAKGHRRHQTMETHLDGLADVLGDIHGGTLIDAVAMDAQLDAVGEEVPHAQTANLYQRGRKKSMEHEAEPSSEADIEAADGSPEEKDDGLAPLSPTHKAALRKSTPQETRGNRLMRKIPLFPELGVLVNARQSSIRSYLLLIFWIMIPAGAISFCLYYFAGNPPTGQIDLDIKRYNGTLVNKDGDLVDPGQASTSWWLLFILVRQLVTLTLAQAVQFLVIDFLSIGMQLTSRYLGPIPTLLIVQSRGWPFLLMAWSLLDLGMLSGGHEFAAHWLFWQDTIGFFNESNPSGGVPADPLYARILIIGIIVGLIVAAKRTWIGFFFGRKTYVNYAEELSAVIHKVILLSKVGNLAKEIETRHVIGNKRAEQQQLIPSDQLQSYFQEESLQEVQGGDGEASVASENQSPYVIDPERKERSGSLTDAQKARIVKLLGAWEEPEKTLGVEEDVSLRAILKFRQSLTFLDTPFTFSHAFGLVDTRESCIESAQEVFLRLLLDAPDEETDVLNFEVLARVAVSSDGQLRTEVLKDLIALLRPDRNGDMTLLDFVKSVDAVYKQARLLRGSIKNSQKIDRAFENIFNILFYVVMGCVILSQLGFDPFALFLSVSGIILAFAFMIGSASAKYFEGLLFILVQRPYDIGDRINIEPQHSPGQPNGSVSWIVKDVTLFTTTVVLGATNEKATISNGALAQCRILNGARSPNATISIFMKFGIEVPYEKTQIFLDAMTSFVKARPREWVALLAFRSTDIQADRGFIQYITLLQHRSSWQDIGALKASQAQLQAFALELAKRLNMRFQSPPLPVNLTLGAPPPLDDEESEDNDGEESEDVGDQFGGLNRQRVSTEDFLKVSSLFQNKK